MPVYRWRPIAWASKGPAPEVVDTLFKRTRNEEVRETFSSDIHETTTSAGVSNLCRRIAKGLDAQFGLRRLLASWSLEIFVEGHGRFVIRPKYDVYDVERL